MTAKAATTYTLPTETTEQALPSGVTGIKINTTTAKVYQDNNLAGVAFWKLGLEKNSIWDTIAKYVD